MTARFAPGTELTLQQVADLFDHALLKPELTTDDVRSGVAEVAALNAFSVCVRPSDITLAVEAIAATTAQGAGEGDGQPSRTTVCTVIGFPHGTTSTAAKVAEAEQAVADGATELDMVLNIGRLRSGQVDAVREDIAAVVEAGHAHDVPVKVIFETALLDDAQKEAACRASAEAGADFVKTSTGFAGGGATLPDVRLMRANSPETVQVKASGGVRDVDTLLAMLAEGVTRIGTSSTSALLAEARERLAAGTLVVPEPADTLDTPERDSLY
ncbi:deoxyribose-phosphate aldolase [Kytococcus sedentarius]|uniref:Deoxyribose-phosphate aldolase n=1 Tax=Kytococcus sedentarius (strain ATCC 14392 / DSM 20547 / JCM 11482 / CCUG 33030 / NBRC 15357 / NCTC 11040 / CCM 314 / 541) TaxID=478801 RepID=C7NFD2_KYTSD|nr:deoxyribose-phosphate aldolase [Kytococcus sedentarius]ACV05867.1 deoxyribose-phosphate aldolase [Kytococcus sedentarius DSM 20547]QQB64263.1 deoxyribose-phosphate aldolase [Kytococcus sedentarius]STX12717.1 Deoxyribose-phosphate aldolase 1 [Kytococcus sedentarius]